MSDSLPKEIIESIAISNAKSIGEQPAILANMALSNQILNNNMQQQMALGFQQAMNQITMATTSKCVSLISNPEGDDQEVLKDINDLMKILQELKKNKNTASTNVNDEKTMRDGNQKGK